MPALSSADQTNFDVVSVFMGNAQKVVVRECLRGEEREHFSNVMAEFAERIRTMPVTYEQDGKGDEAIAYLRIFGPALTYYITEKDMEGAGNEQAFGLACNGDIREIGYIHLHEVLARNDFELDFYYEPKSIRQIKNECRDS